MAEKKRKQKPDGDLAKSIGKEEESDSHGNSANQLVNKKRKQKPDPHVDLANPLGKRIKESNPHKDSENPLVKKKSNESFYLSRSQVKNKSASSLCKGKSAMEPSNSTQEHMDSANQIKEISFDQTTMSLKFKFNLSRCRLKNQSALSPEQFCKGKSAMEPSIGLFQEEIIMEILSRLPVRSLHRFKCVSKFWMALISDPYFKKKHLNRAKNDENFQKLLTAKKLPDKDYMYCCLPLSSVPLVEDEQKLDFPLNMRRCHPRMLCSCDGLVLVAVYERKDDRFDQHLLLWNPSTRESKLLPHPGQKLSDWLFGLGYDTSSNDYKILAKNLNHISVDFLKVYCKILDLKSGSWRYCKYPTVVSCMFDIKYPTVLSCMLAHMGSAMDYLAFIHGAFHWIAYSVYNKPIVITFDISNEVFGEIPLPGNFPFGVRLDCGVSVLGGKLCSYVASWEFSIERKSDPCKLWVWEMKDYGVKESWTSLLSIQDTNQSHVVRPQYRYADGEVLLHCQAPTSADFIYRRTRGPLELSPTELIVFNGIAYTESLISPKLLS